MANEPKDDTAEVVDADSVEEPVEDQPTAERRQQCPSSYVADGWRSMCQQETDHDGKHAGWDREGAELAWTDAEAYAPPAEPPPETESTAIAKAPDRTPLSQRDPVSIAKHFAASGYFEDARGMSQAVVKIVAGEELGFGPMTAMNGIHIIEGKPSMSANLLATLVKRPTLAMGGRNPYKYRVREFTDEVCRIDFYEGDEHLGESKFTIEMAERAGLVKPRSNWEKWPEAMCYSRAMSQGVRLYCPEVTAGNPAYTPEELGAEVDEQGEPLKVVAEIGEVDEPATQAEPAISGERATEIAKGIEHLGLDPLQFNTILGSCGLDGLAEATVASVVDRIATLTTAEADAVERALDDEATPAEEGGAA